MRHELGMHQGRRLFLNTFVNAASKPVTMLIAFLLTPFIVHHLGKEAYGIWALTGSALAYTSLLKVGLNSAVNLHVPKLAWAGDQQGINRVVKTAMAFYVVSAAAAALFVVVLVWKFPDWFAISGEMRRTSRFVVALAGAGVVTLIPLQVFGGVLTGLQRYDFVVGRVLFFQVLRAIAVVILFQQGFGLITLATLFVAGDLAGAIAAAGLAYKSCPGLSLRQGVVDWSLLPSLIAYSTSSLMFGAGQLVQMQAGKIIAGLLFTPTGVAEFAIPFALLTLVGQTVVTSGRAIKPAVSLLDAQDRPDAIRRAYLLSTKAALLVAVPAAIVFIGLGGPLIHAWIGPDFSDVGGLLLAILAGPQMLRVAQTGGFFVLTGLGRHRVFGVVVMVQAVVSVVLAWALAGPGGLGLPGIAWGIALPDLVVSGWILPRHVNRELGVSFRDVMRDSIVPAVKAAIPLLLWVAAVRTLHPPADRIELAIVLIVGGLLAAAGAAWLGLDARERRRFVGYLRPGRRRPPSVA